ncbi:MAG: hypothetical protein WCY62_11220 [Clostridia bacterium]
MKKRIVSIVLLVVLLLGLALTVSAACDHTYWFLYSETGPYYYYDDTYCVRDYTEYKHCEKCYDLTQDTVQLYSEHSILNVYYHGTLSTGVEWWYGDCINCGTRFDFFW